MEFGIARCGFRSTAILYCLLIFSLLLPTISVAQDVNSSLKEIRKNIFRTNLTYIVPDDEGMPLQLSYERQLYKPITIVAGGGLSFVPSVNNDAELSIHGFASIELRYYFNLMRRIRKEKYVKNFSATYISFQESLFSGPIALIGVSSANSPAGKARTFFNLGLQRQFKQYYFNVFLGPGLHFTDLEKGEWVMIDDFHVGIGFGIVLFE